MTPCCAVEIVTPKKFVLRGLWFGPQKPKRCIVWVHGLGSSAFSMQSVITALTDGSTAVLAFNNRGHDIVANLPRKVAQTEKRPKRILAGAAHEKFTDCVDDIQGAINFAKKQSAKNIYLAGHSTGCQKSIYWAFAQKSRGVKGIILLAPVNDYLGALAWHGRARLAKAQRFARRLLSRGKPHEFLPTSVWDEEPDDAQRFLSLYTPESVENIFPYDRSRAPRVLRSVSTPLLVVWAQNDEYADRPVSRVIEWFKAHLNPKSRIVIANARHSFKGAEREVAHEIKKFITG